VIFVVKGTTCSDVISAFGTSVILFTLSPVGVVKSSTYNFFNPATLCVYGLEISICPKPIGVYQFLKL